MFDELISMIKKSKTLPLAGAEALVDWQNDKPTVVALREIAEGKIDRTLLLEADPEPAPAMIPQENPLDLPSDFRAPQFGLGD